MMTLMKQLPGRQGKALSNRYKARRFTHNEDAYKFLATGDNSLHWSRCKQDLKSGTYTSQMGADTNTRKAVITYTRVSR